MKTMNHPVVISVVLVLVGVGGGYAWWTADATVVRLTKSCGYPAEVRETAAEAQMTLAPFPTISLHDISLHDRALIRERIDVALDPTRAVLGSATSEISDIASQFIVARFGSSTDEYLALRLSAGWTPKSDAEIEIGGGAAALEYFGLNTRCWWRYCDSDRGCRVLARNTGKANSYQLSAWWQRWCIDGNFR